MTENVIGDEAFKEAEKQAEKDKKNLDSAKKMQDMMENLSEATATTIIDLVKSKKQVDLSDMKAEISKSVESGMMMGLMVPIMCH